MGPRSCGTAAGGGSQEVHGNDSGPRRHRRPISIVVQCQTVGYSGRVMNARQLEVFRAIMRNRSLTAAAESLHVSQPAVSKVLRHFEIQIGYKLFERLGGRLVPTAEAQLLYRDADRIFREIVVLQGLSDRIRDKQLGLLRVGASAPPTFALLPHAIERFRPRNP